MGSTEEQQQKKKNNKMVNLIPIIVIITLNVNGLKSPIKRQRLSDWIKKKDPTVCHLQATHFKCKDMDTLKDKL